MHLNYFGLFDYYYCCVVNLLLLFVIDVVSIVFVVVIIIIIVVVMSLNNWKIWFLQNKWLKQTFIWQCSGPLAKGYIFCFLKKYDFNVHSPFVTTMLYCCSLPIEFFNVFFLINSSSQELIIPLQKVEKLSYCYVPLLLHQ